MATSIGAESFEDGFLLARFRGFYARLVDYKERVRQSGWTDPGTLFQAGEGAPGGEAESDGDRGPMGLADGPFVKPETAGLAAGESPGAGRRVPSADAIARDLQTILERDALDAARIGGSYGAGIYREAQYLMAALADEVFLNESAWEDRGVWQRRLLEHRLFNSSVAGERIFKRIDQVLAERDPVLGELAILYLLALSAGFRGRYRGVDDAGQIDRYKRELFQFVAKRKPRLAGDRKLFKAAYLEPHRGENRARLPYLRPWLLAIGGFLLLYLLVSLGLWELMTLPLNDVLREIR